mmetsp:Transcript_56827/g.64406  ORF Transcript_56827/g.64406 Transcript_56827/m.64406 type:complete len:1252 (+) Transcript_56827:72-3827(+)
MRIPTLAILTAVLAIIEQNPFSFAFHVPSKSLRLSLETSSSSRYGFHQIQDNRFVTAIRSSTTDIAAGQEDKNDNYYVDDNELFEAYSDWREEYVKGDFDSIRFQNFHHNFLKLILVNSAEIKNARESGNPDPIPKTLNEYGDYSVDEFTAMQIEDQDQAPSEFQVLSSANVHRPLQTIQSAEFSFLSIEEQNRILRIYEEWCFVNGKIYEESRIDIFAFNLIVVENYYKETGEKIELNQNADLSPEEYESTVTTREEYLNVDQSTIQQYSSYLENLSTNVQIPSLSPSMTYQYQHQYQYQYQDEAELEKIRQMYIQWCITNEKEYIESRLVVFANNVLAVENYREETGKNVKLSKYADLSPEEYNAMESSSSSDKMGKSSYRNSYLENLANPSSNNNGPGVEDSSYLNSMTSNRKEVQHNTIHDSSNTPMTSSYDKGSSNLNDQSENPLTISTEETIYAVYQDWCQYYEKVPTENGRYHFTGNYKALEKHHRETGEELTLNENADSIGTEYPQQISEEIERKAESPEQVRWEHEQNKVQENEQNSVEENEAATQVDEAENEHRRQDNSQIENDQTQTKNMNLRRQNLAEKTTIHGKNCSEGTAVLDVELENNRLREEENRIQEALSIDQALLEEEKRLEEAARIELDEKSPNLDTTLQNDELQSPTSTYDDDNKVEDETFLLPRGSYMNAVAKTWVDRSAYLESLQQGKIGGVLPENPNFNQESAKISNQSKKKRSESLIDSILNFIKDNRSDGRLATEQYSKRLIQKADKIIADASKLSRIEEEELQHLKAAVDTLRRRNKDERAGQVARTEAKEWERIQKRLEKEAKRARERREQEERLVEEVRRKAYSLKSERRRYEKNIAEKSRTIEPALTDDDSTARGYPFSFFNSPFQFGESQDVINSPAVKKLENVNLIVGASIDSTRKRPPSKTSTKPITIENNESWLDKLFDYFGRYKEEEIPGLGTITLEPAKRSAVFDFFVTPDARAPGQGSLTIEDSQKPSILSFFTKFSVPQKSIKKIDPERRQKVIDYENKLRSRQEKLSWLEAGRSRILEQKDRKMSRKEARRLQRELESLAYGNSTASVPTPRIPQLAKWTQTPDGRITGWVSDSTGGHYKMGTKITTSPIKGKVVKPGMTVTTISGSVYRLGLSATSSSFVSNTEVRPNSERSINSRPSSILPMGGLFGRLFTGENVPSLVEWTQNEDGTLTGLVNNKEGFDDGTQIETSPVKKGVISGMLVQTKGGSKYKLL